MSSRPQAEKDSIEKQIEDGRTFCAGMGWLEVATLIVPGESRNYIDVADAIAGLDERLQPGEPNAYRDLLGLLSARSLDVLVCRSRDRLGRTDALIAGVEERCRRAGAIVWSLAMPPSGSEAGDLYVSAVERAGAQRELVELRRRQKDGMDGRARRGELVGSIVPFGYAAEQVRVGRRFERRAVVIEREADAYRLAVADVIARSATEDAIAARLRAHFPERRWPTASLYSMFRNPFYIGLIVRRRKRGDGENANLRVVDPGGLTVLKNPLWPDVEQLLALRAERDRYANIDTRGIRRLTLVAPGLHQPIVDIALWLDLQRETELRSATRHPPSKEALWGGLARCGICGSRMHFNINRGRGYFYRYYRCSLRDGRRGTCTNPPVRQETITAGVAVILQGMYRQLQDRLSDTAPSTEPVDPTAGLLAQRADLAAQRERLEIMAQTGRISFDAFDERVATVDAACIAIDDRLHREQAIVVSRESAQARFVALESVIDGLAGVLAEADPLTANHWLRELVEAVYIRDGRVAEVRMRL